MNECKELNRIVATLFSLLTKDIPTLQMSEFSEPFGLGQPNGLWLYSACLSNLLSSVVLSHI